MNNYSSNKYIFSPQRRGHGGTGSGTYIVIPNPSHTGSMLSNCIKPLTSLFNRVCPMQCME